MDAEKPRLPLTDYLPELVRLREAGADFVLVAGQAVNFWASRYSDTKNELHGYRPFVSKDVDLFGSFHDLYMIPKILGGELKRFQDVRTPVMGVFTTDSEPFLMFELLRGVYGPVKTEKIVARAKSLEGIAIIDPISLLICKVHNAAGIDQDGRQDVRHVQMMVLVSHSYYSDLCDAVGGQITPRQFINECKFLLDFADNPAFRKGLSMSAANLSDCFPLAKIKIIGQEHEAIGRYYENTFFPMWKN